MTFVSYQGVDKTILEGVVQWIMKVFIMQTGKNTVIIQNFHDWNLSSALLI